VRLRAKDRALDQVGRLLPTGERALVAEICQVKPIRSATRAAGAAAGGFVRDVTITSVTTALGVGLSGGSTAAVWLVVTDRRLLVFDKTSRITEKKLEATIPLPGVEVTGRRGRLLRSVWVHDEASGEALAAFNLGWRSGAQQRLVEAASRRR
jgi:hypothetical protein